MDGLAQKPCGGEQMMGRMVYYDSNGNEIEPPKADPVPMTNADSIRSMTDEELAGFLETVNTCSCSFVTGKSPCVSDGCPCWREWLKEEVSE